MLGHLSIDKLARPLARKVVGLLASRRVAVSLSLSLIIGPSLVAATHAQAKKRRAPLGGTRAVVVDERLAVLRESPQLTASLLQRLGRGRAVAILGAHRAGDGVSFYRVAVTSRTRGWLQTESVVSPAHAGDDARLLRLIRGSQHFDRLARARIFLDTFPRSPLRAAALQLFGEAADEAAVKLSSEAERSFNKSDLNASGAPLHSYYLNFNGLDRYRKQGIVFNYDPHAKALRYDGATWHELLRRFPHSPEAETARQRLALR